MRSNRLAQVGEEPVPGFKLIGQEEEIATVAAAVPTDDRSTRMILFALQALAKRQNGIVKDMSGMPKTPVLSPAEQQQNYQQMADPSWVDEAMQTAKHPGHKRLLGIVKKHGLKGLGSMIDHFEGGKK